MEPSKRRPWYTVLYVQVLIAIALGIAVGHNRQCLLLAGLRQVGKRPKVDIGVASHDRRRTNR